MISTGHGSRRASISWGHGATASGKIPGPPLQGSQNLHLVQSLAKVGEALGAAAPGGMDTLLVVKDPTPSTQGAASASVRVAGVQKWLLKAARCGIKEWIGACQRDKREESMVDCGHYTSKTGQE
jgi:hypothetical protein